MELLEIEHVVILNEIDGANLVNTYLKYGWKLIAFDEAKSNFVLGCTAEIYSEWPESKINDQRKKDFPEPYDYLGF
jgi:hypothetical protein